jgi:hypothetical protein
MADSINPLATPGLSKALMYGPKPARDYPNQNSLHGMAITYDSRPVSIIGAPAPITPSTLLKLNTAVPIGTLPARAFVTGLDWSVAAASTGAATLDLGTIAAPTKWLTAVPLNAIAIGAAAAATLGYVANVDTVVVATLKGSADLSNAVFKFLLSYYSKAD